jgi:hypothetical protein
VSDLAQKKCKTIFIPLIDVLVQRIRFIMKSIWKTVINYILDSQIIQEKFKTFFENLQKISDEFIEKVLIDVRNKIDDEFLTFTKIIDWDLLGIYKTFNFF